MPIFLLIAFGVAWCYLFIARLALGLSLVNPLVQIPIGFAPAVAAVVVRRWVTKEGFRDAGLALRFRKERSSYFLAWSGPPLLVVATLAVAAATGVWHLDLAPLRAGGSGPEWVMPLLLMIAVVPLTPVYWGEEFGWTGYLRPRLYADRPVPSVLVTGLIWAVWHYPLAFLGYIDFGDTARGVILGLAAWTVSLIFQEVILAWLWVRSGSVWVPSLAHSGNNMVLSLLTGELLSKQGVGVTASTLLVTVPIAVVGLWILATDRLRPAGSDGPLAAYAGRDRVPRP